MKNIFLTRNNYLSRRGDGFLYAIYTEEPLSDFEIEKVNSLSKLIKPSEVNLFISNVEFDREIRFLGVGQSTYESNFYFFNSVDENKFEFFNLIKRNYNNFVHKQKNRRGLYRRTCEIDGSLIRKEFSGGSVAQKLYGNGVGFLKEGIYRDRFVSSFSDEKSCYYSYTYKKLPGDMTLYDVIFNADFCPQTLYTRYISFASTLWPYVHLDLHGDNISISYEDNQENWYAIDFESVVKTTEDIALKIYNGIFLQMIGHVKPETLHLIKVLDVVDFMGLTKEREVCLLKK